MYLNWCDTIKVIMEITSKYIYKLRFFKKVDSFAEIKGGKSGARTFCVQSNNKKYFVKFRAWNTKHQSKNFKLFAKYVNTPKVYKSGKVNGVQYYIADYIGDKATRINSLPNEKINQIAKSVAQEQSQIAKNQLVTESIKKRIFKQFFRETSSIFKTAISLFKKTKENLENDVRIYFEKVFEDITKFGKEYLMLFQDAEVVYCHSDFRIENFFLIDEKIITVDFEESYFNYIPFACRAYCYELILNRGNDSEWNFTKGIVETFCKSQFLEMQRQFVAVYYRVFAQCFMVNIDNAKRLKDIANNMMNNESNVNRLEDLFAFGHKDLMY